MSNIVFQTILGANLKRSESKDMTIDFTGIRLGADNLAVVQGGTGVSAFFDFGSRSLRTTFLPVNQYDLVNKSYVDGIAQSLLIKDAVFAATTTALNAVTASGVGAGKTLTATANGALSIDGVSPAAGVRVLIKDQADGKDNGIYVVTDAGSVSTPFVLTRAIDFDGTPTFEVRDGVFTFVQQGTVNSDSGFVLVTNGTITVDTTVLSFTQFSGAGQITVGAGLEKIGNAIAVRYDDSSIGINGSNQLEVKDLGITTSKLADQSVNEAKLSTSVAGNGLTGGNGAPLAVGAGEAMEVGADNIGVDFSVAKTNDNASPVTIRKVVYVKANGNIDLATKANASKDVELLITRDASVPASGSGKFIARRGAIIPGFTGLTPGAEYMINTAGDIALYSAITYAVGEYVHIVGKALSATELIFNPYYRFEY